uniref:TEP1-F n=1 Tax=Ammothea sp. RS-2014 TaxID=1569307 RepID=A0A0E4B7X5_9CHEL|nr:thioester-containing protein [Ammothea sp. RS-2014]
MTLAIIIIFIFLYPSVESQGYYTVVAPKVLRPDTRYHIGVSIYNTTSTVHVAVQLTGNLRVSSELDVRGGDTGLVTFQIGNWSAGVYKLEVVGSRGLDFRNSTEIKFVARSLNVFIQTDKSVYRSSQKVQFRAIILDKSLWPRRTAVEIYITDADGNRVKHYRGLNARLGLVSEELQLPDQPVLGVWIIHVVASGQEYKKSFSVAEYVLPGFYVKVKLSPSFVTYDNPLVRATVSATYNYGKPVKGTVTLTVIPKHRTTSISVRPLDSYQTILPLNKEVTHEINVRRVLNLITDNLKREIEFMAIVEEELTGRRYNGSNSIFIYNDPVKLELIKTSQSFKPGLVYKAFLKVSRQDNTPLNLPNGALTLKYAYNYKPGSTRSDRYRIPTNGLIELNFFPPLSKDTVTIFTKADFNGKEYDLAYVDKAYSPSNTYMQITLNTPFPQVDQEVEVLVNCTSQLPQYVYQVIARGNILRTRSVRPPGGNSHSFKVQMTDNMAPLVRIVVYFTRDDGEIVADGLSLDLEKIFENQISFTAGPGVLRPREKVRISLNTDPNSMVGLMGIDQRNLVLDPGNDITQNDVIRSLEGFDSGKKDSDQQMILQLPVRRGRALFYPGSLSAASVFDDAGVTVMSNGIVNSFDRRKSKSAPPGEGVYDFKIVPFGAARPPDTPQRPRTPFINIDLPPTWLWWNRTVGSDGSASLESHVPENMTSWIISAFSISPTNGLALAQNSAKVTVFERFFVKLILPHSVILGETLSVQVVVFNYNDRPAQVEVTMENKGGFEFTTVEDDPSIRRATRMRKATTVPAQEGKATYFMIKPNRLGYIDIKVFARSSFAGDGAQDKLLVKPTGGPQYFNRPILIDRRSAGGEPLSVDVELNIPRTVIRGSEKIEVTAIADVMGPVIENLGDLLRIPRGCGEQNMVNFVPNILVINYLKGNNRLANDIYSKAIGNIGTGYLRELTYKHDDGSFSSFGRTDNSGSTWLTAFVLKTFKQAKEHIPDMIDDEVVKAAMSWLSKQLQFNGTFAEPGSVLNKELQGGAKQGLPLTAYVLIALHENREYYDSVAGALDSARQAQSSLEQNYASIDDTYTLAIISYALQLVNSPRRDAAFQQLASRARFGEETMYWSANVRKPNNPEEVFHLPSSSDIEMTSYALMTYTLRGDISTSLRIMKWLVERRNSLGGFTSTQDTVIGIQALTMLTNNLNIRGSNLEITYSYNENADHNNTFPIRKKINVNDQNSLNMQSRTLPVTVRKVRISAEGRGIAMVQVSWSFNLKVSAPNPSFGLNPLVDKVSTKGYLQVSSCINYIPEGESGMAVMEFYAPSGYVVDRSSLSSIRQESIIKRVETYDDETMVAIYFDKIGKEPVCPTVSAYRVHRVANQQQKPVVVYDYYNRAQIARVFYRLAHVTKKEEICDGYECDKSNTRRNDASVDQRDKNSSVSLNSFSNILILTQVLTFLTFQVLKSIV